MPSQIGRIKRLSLLFVVASGVTADAPLARLSPFEMAVNSKEGQVPGPSFIGDSTICDGRGCEGNFFRIKSHNDFFDLTVWGPDPELGISQYEALPPHMIELRGSSNERLIRLRVVGDRLQWSLGNALVWKDLQ